MRLLSLRFHHLILRLVTLISSFILITTSAHAEPVVTTTTAASAQNTDISKYNNKATELAVKGFANEAFMAGYGYDFVNYKEELLLASHYFTPDAWSKFVAASDQANMINTSINASVFVTASAERSPVILNQGVLQGNYAWWVTFPADVTLLGKDSVLVKHVNVKMLISVSNGSEGVRGMVVKNVIIDPSDGKPTS